MMIIKLLIRLLIRLLIKLLVIDDKVIDGNDDNKND